MSGGPAGRSARCLQQFTRMRPADFALCIAPEHPRDLRDALLPLEHTRVRRGHAAALALADEDVMVRASGDLGEVGYREHLMLRGDAAHRVTDLESHASADTSVHLVEYQG